MIQMTLSYDSYDSVVLPKGHCPFYQIAVLSLSLLAKQIGRLNGDPARVVTLLS